MGYKHKEYCGYNDDNYVACREWCQMYLKAAKLAEAMQVAVTSSQPSGRSASPEAISHGRFHWLSVLSFSVCFTVITFCIQHHLHSVRTLVK